MAESKSAADPIARIPLHDEVVRKLSGMILRGDLAPGSRVPERLLCEQLAISRTPLREALKVLASSGLVELRPARGAWIAPLRATEVAETFEVLALLERRAGALAAPRLDDAAVRALERLHEAMIAHGRGPDSEAMLRLDLRIHRGIVEAAGNRTLVQVHEGLAIKVERARYLAAISPERVRHSMQEHEVILAAIQARDPDGMAEALHMHCLRTSEAVVAAVLARTAQDRPSRAA
jgi:DNA-binding GntR family transcriptional regulator